MKFLKKFNEENIAPGSLLGMGNVVTPQVGGGVGSGDVFSTSKETEKKKKKKRLKSLEYIMELDKFIKQ